jgi:hypothetical protein
MVNVYWKGGTGGTKSDISAQANWVDSAGTQISNTVWNSGNLSAHDIILDRTKNITPSDPVGIILDGSPSTVTFNSLYIKYSDNSKWHNMLQFGNSQTTLVLSGLDIRQSEMISATATTTIKFTGIPHHNSSAVSGNTTGTVGGGNDAADLYVKIVDEDTNLNSFFNRSLDYSGNALTLANQYRTAGMFLNTASRGYITFLYEPPNNTLLVLDDGIYPKMDFDCTGSNTAILCFDDVFTNQGSKSNSYGMVDMLNLNIDSSFKVKPRQHLLQNKQKHIKLSGGYTLNCTVFDMGYTTLEIIPTVNNASASGYIPSSDTPLFGITPSATQKRGMKVKYTKLIIGSPVNDSYKLLIADNNIITCEELVIKAGGRLYGTNYGDDNTAEIHCLKQPIIEGDWNFTEISKGIYRAAGTTPTLPVTMGGTGLNEIGLQSQVLAVKSDGTGLEWRASGGGSVGGSDTELLYNDGGTENGIASLTWTDTAGSEQLLLSDSSDTSLFKIIQTGTGDALEVHDQASDTTVFKVDQSGHVQIGTTSENIGALRLKGYQGTSSVSGVSTYRISRLEDGVSGSLEITSSQSDGDMYVGAGSTGADLILHTRRSSPSTANYENLRLTSNGEIGIEGSNFGDSGQVLTSGGIGEAVSWTTPSGGGSGTVTPSSTDTFINKTIDANGTGNLITNIDIGNMTPAVIQLSTESFSNDDVTLMTSAAIEDKIAAQVSAALAAQNYDLSPIAFELRSLGTATGVKIPAVASGTSAAAIGYPMPLAGKVKYVSFVFTGGAITGNAINEFRVVKNNTSTSSNYLDVDVNAETLINKGGSGEYIYTHVSSLGVSALGFAAGDVIWVQRFTGSTDLQHAYVVLWVGI